MGWPTPCYRVKGQSGKGPFFVAAGWVCICTFHLPKWPLGLSGLRSDLPPPLPPAAAQALLKWHLLKHHTFSQQVR